MSCACTRCRLFYIWGRHSAASLSLKSHSPSLWWTPIWCESSHLRPSPPPAGPPWCALWHLENVQLHWLIVLHTGATALKMSRRRSAVCLLNIHLAGGSFTNCHNLHVFIALDWIQRLVVHFLVLAFILVDVWLPLHSAQESLKPHPRGKAQQQLKNISKMTTFNVLTSPVTPVLSTRLHFFLYPFHYSLTYAAFFLTETVKLGRLPDIVTLGLYGGFDSSYYLSSPFLHLTTRGLTC